MTRNARIAALAASAIVIIIAIVFTLRSTDGSPPSEEGSQAAAPTSTATREAPAAESGGEATATPQVLPSFAVKKGRPVDGAGELSVKKGSRVRFAVQADAPESVHLHGYDIEKPVAPGRPARFDFKARIDGVFEVELEQSAVLVLNLKVNP